MLSLLDGLGAGEGAQKLIERMLEEGVHFLLRFLGFEKLLLVFLEGDGGGVLGLVGLLQCLDAGGKVGHAGDGGLQRFHHFAEILEGDLRGHFPHGSAGDCLRGRAGVE